MQSKFSNNAPLLGIVTVLYNSDDVLPGFFDSLAALEKPHNFRLYVIDNSAQDSGMQLPLCHFARTSRKQELFP